MAPGLLVLFGPIVVTTAAAFVSWQLLLSRSEVLREGPVAGALKQALCPPAKTS
jgi:hypothetical protein